MAKRKCKFGVVKSGPRKGRCRKRKLTGAAARKTTRRRKRRGRASTAHCWCAPGYEIGQHSTKTGKRFKKPRCVSKRTGRSRPMKCKMRVTRTRRVG